MANTPFPAAIRRIFTETFTARDIAEPLASFDASTSAAEVGDFMNSSNFDVVGVRKAGRVVGYVERNNLAHAQDIPESDWDTIVSLCGLITR
jgi:hypothetical protein